MSLTNKKLVRGCLGLLCAWVVASCGGGGSAATPAPPPAATLTSIALSPLTVSLPDGGTQQLTVTGTYSNNTTAAIPAADETFASSNSAVATVSSAGVVTVVAGAATNATAVISATNTASGLATSTANSTVVTVGPPPVGPTPNSAAAAKATAANNAECKSPNITNAFYWEIGDKNGALVSGIQPSATDTTLDPQGNQISASTSLWSVASASKWIYASYVVEVRSSATILAESPTDASADVTYLNFTSGWVYLGNFPPTSNTCGLLDTVDQCIAGIPNTPATPNATAVGKFWYDDDHMEQHASAIMSLGGQGVGDLSTTILGVLGVNLNFSYSIPILAAGVYTTSDDYAAFLRNILNGTYQMSKTLSAFPVCTNSTVAGCNAVAGQSPIASASNNAEAWHYSLGHWIEDDPTVGDGSFSSPGALGFYPWIDKNSTYYGLLVREDDVAKTSGAYEGYQSAVCGRLIRQAWMSGVEQTGASPVFTSQAQTVR